MPEINEPAVFNQNSGKYWVIVDGQKFLARWLPLIDVVSASNRVVVRFVNDEEPETNYRLSVVLTNGEVKISPLGVQC